MSCPVCIETCSVHTADNLTACTSCGHVFQTDLTVTVSYNADYARQYDRRPAKQMSDVRWNFIQQHLGLLHGSRVLDIGYGNGAFLKRARDAGMSIYGIDVHSEDFGIPTVSFDTRLNFDLICFFDSLEHLPDFNAVLQLKAGAVIVSIPRTPKQILTRPSVWRHYKPGEHLHYFSTHSLDKLMDRWGFQTKVADGHPEDELRGKILLEDEWTDNIYSCIYARPKA